VSIIKLRPSAEAFVPERVRPLDPLGADEMLRRLPQMNEDADVAAIAGALRVLLPDGTTCSELSYDECLAAMRDLGMFVGSLRRHEIEPVVAVVGLEPVLVELGRRTDMVPRETIHHYTELNPRDHRLRTYTAYPEEPPMMDSVRTALARVGDALASCEQLVDLELGTPELPELLTGLAEALGAFDAGINLLNEKVPPEFFYVTMRPYYDEIEVAGRRYQGPTAGHVPLSVVDIALWAADHGSGRYDDYRLSGLQYTLPRWRALAARWARGPSLTARMSAALRASAAGEPAPARLADSAAALAAALRVLVVFRGKHITYAPHLSGGLSGTGRQRWRDNRAAAGDPRPHPAERQAGSISSVAAQGHRPPLLPARGDIPPVPSGGR
jgi:hypothetical protein